MVEGVLNGSVCSFEDGPIALAEFPELSEHVVSIDVCDLGRGVSVSYWQARLEFHIFRIIEVAGQKDFLDSEDELPACEQWVLPCRALGSSLWDSVVLPADIKRQLLGYGTSSTLFADRGINSEIISWNRMILLYGPPGTG